MSSAVPGNEHSSHWLSAVLDIVQVGVITIDRHGHITSFNREAESMFGYVPEEVVGRNVSMLMPSPDREAHDDYLDRYLTTGERQIIGIGREVHARRADGSTFPVELAVSEVQVGDDRAFVGTLRDLSRLRGVNALHQAILDQAVDGLITIDTAGRIESCNAATEDIFGYAEDELIGRNISMLMPSPYRDEHDGYLDRYHETGDARIIGRGREVQGLRRNGEVFPLELGVAEVDVEGRRVYSGIVRDITARRNAEDALVRSNEALSQFAYVASHDLQAPARTISGFASVLREELGDDASPEVEEYLGYIQDASDHMTALVVDLLHYSRLEGPEPETTSVDTNRILDAVITTLHDVIASNPVDVKVTRKGLPVLHTQPARFQRLLQNLVQNAINYGPTKEPCRVHVEASREDGAIRFSVTDNGMGIAATNHHRIFEMFARLHLPAHSPHRGTGVGLASCKRIVEGFGGRIWVESEPGSGSTFHFTVPSTHTG